MRNFSAETRMLWSNRDNIMASDGLAAYVTKASAVMLLSLLGR